LVRVLGALAGHVAAAAFAEEVHRVHRRYLHEVVAAFALCPHVKPPGVRGPGAPGAEGLPSDGEAAFGAFVVMLDREPDVGATVAAARTIAEPVAHLVFPLVTLAPPPFERFASAFGDAVRRERLAAGEDVPVLAAFHPGLDGDTTTPDRLIGLLRRAPDPFVQLVPDGLAQGGTVLAAMRPDGTPELPASDRGDHGFENWRRLRRGPIDAILARVAEIHADRARGYAPHLAALGVA
jgi:hypothetical protein